MSTCIAGLLTHLEDFRDHNYRLRLRMVVTKEEAAFHLILSLMVNLTADYA